MMWFVADPYHQLSKCASDSLRDTTYKYAMYRRLPFQVFPGCGLSVGMGCFLVDESQRVAVVLQSEATCSSLDFLDVTVGEILSALLSRVELTDLL